MNCPVCHTRRLEDQPLESNLMTAACPDCGGHWIKSFQYWEWQAGHGANLPETAPSKSVSLPVNDSGPGKLCPECGGFLIAHKVGHGVAFTLDRCGRCGGVWLDGNEWDTLKARNLHDDIHLIFSEAWQAKVKHQERTQQYGQVVLGIQDQKLRQTCSEQDLAEIKRIKAWLDAHPNSQQLYVYLASTRGL